jgi:hypothetical protein
MNFHQLESGSNEIEYCILLYVPFLIARLLMMALKLYKLLDNPEV